MKVYISSTFVDLVDYRAAAAAVLRKLGHDVRGMEMYVSESSQPVDVCVHDVHDSDVLVLVLAWRYGYVPSGTELSITEQEYEAATAAKRIVVLPFIVPPDAPWPAHQMDAINRESERELIERFRGRVSRDHVVARFRSPEELASEVAAAMRRAEATNQLSERALRAADRGQFSIMRRYGDLSDTAAMTIVEAIRSAAGAEVLTVEVGRGDQWWSTRLYLLASLAADLTSIRQLLFVGVEESNEVDKPDQPVVIGLATPELVRDRLVRAFPVLAEFHAAANEGPVLQDVEDESRRRLGVWHEFFTPRVRARPNGEEGARVWVREGLLDEWLGSYLIRGSVEVEGDGQLSATQVQQILNWPLPYVPVVGARLGRKAQASSADRGISVVNRDAFARQIAQEWIDRELPRSVTS